MNGILIKPLGYVINDRTETLDDHWSSVESTIELIEEMPVECFDGIEQFSHLEIIFYFHQSTKAYIGSQHPREDKAYPKVGIFAQRKKDRPNHIGVSVVQMVKREGKRITVKYLDAIDGTPVIDIKPVFEEYLPKGDIKQPDWTRVLMKNYW